MEIIYGHVVKLEDRTSMPLKDVPCVEPWSMQQGHET